MASKATKAEYKSDPARALEADIFNEAVQGRGGGLWAGTFFGLGYGILAGSLIGLAPAVFTAGGVAALTWQGVVGTAAALGTLGALQGRSAGSENGSASGAAVGSTKVLLTEMRQQFKGLKNEIDQVKDRLEIPKENVLNTNDVANKDDTIAENSATQNRSGFVKWRTAIVSTMLGAAVGLLAYTAGALVGVDAIGDILGKIGFGGEIAPIGAALIGGASGGFFGFNVPLITSKMHMTARETINQRIFQPNEPEVSVEQNMNILPAVPYTQQFTSNVDRLLEQRARYKAQETDIGYLH